MAFVGLTVAGSTTLRRARSTSAVIRRTMARRAAASSKRTIVIDEFAFRHFDDPNYGGLHIDYDKDEFEKKVNDIYEQRHKAVKDGDKEAALTDGYATFCKHLFVPNFVGDSLLNNTMEITEENEPLIRTRYDQRTDDELPVLTRYFPRDKVQPTAARYLDLILYSREQIRKETKAMGRAPADEGVPYELPMNPITIMRNELISQGGSGVPIDRDAYMASVKFWSTHAVVG